MTIIETIKTEDDLLREHNSEKMKEWKRNHRAQYNRAMREYYDKNKDRLRDSRYSKVYGEKERKCMWCGCDIRHVVPRHAKFCNNTHRKYYNAKRKKEWLLNRRMQKLSEVQHPEVPAGQ